MVSNKQCIFNNKKKKKSKKKVVTINQHLCARLGSFALEAKGEEEEVDLLLQHQEQQQEKFVIRKAITTAFNMFDMWSSMSSKLEHHSASSTAGSPLPLAAHASQTPHTSSGSIKGNC